MLVAPLVVTPANAVLRAPDAPATLVKGMVAGLDAVVEKVTKPNR